MNPQPLEPQSNALPLSYTHHVAGQPRSLRIHLRLVETRKRVPSRRAKITRYRAKSTRQEGIEPPTYGLEGRCSIRLSYWREARRIATNIGVRGFEPPTPCAQGRCATRLRYTPRDRSSLGSSGRHPTGPRRLTRRIFESKAKVRRRRDAGSSTSYLFEAVEERSEQHHDAHRPREERGTATVDPPTERRNDSLVYEP